MKTLTPLEILHRIEKSHNFESPSLRQALTPPTADEVCEALSEYFIDKYICVDNKFYNYGGNEPKAVIYKINCSVVIRYDLPPRIITLIGRFYEGLEK